jgi:stage V sporulation protein R
MMGIEYLWGGPVQLETSEVVAAPAPQPSMRPGTVAKPTETRRRPKKVKWERVRYTMKDRKLSRAVIQKPQPS